MNKKKQSDLEIIIVNYNSQFWLKKTLETLKEYFLDQTRLTVSTIVVDNGSSDDSLKMLAKEFPWVETILLEANRGFAVANNVALNKITAPYVLLLNSDIEFTQDSDITPLIKFMDLHSEVGICSPRIEFSSGKLDPACHRGEPTLWASLSYFLGLEKLFPRSNIFGGYHQGYKDLASVHTIDACSGAAMIVRTSAVEKVGLLDEQFFMYAEDLDWCRRFREAGFTIVFNPLVSVIHHKYKSGIKNTSQEIARKTRKHFFNTMLQYYDKYYAERYPHIVRTIIKYFIVFKKGAL